jgi:hypothetical protein
VKLTVQQIEAVLDGNNPQKESFISMFEPFEGEDLFECYRCTSSIISNVRALLERNMPPIYIKRLKLLVGCRNAHDLVKQEAFRYFYFADGTDRQYVAPDESADRFVSEGLGWYFSTMRRNIIVASIAYRPSRAEQEVFDTYTRDYQALPRLSDRFRK